MKLARFSNFSAMFLLALGSCLVIETAVVTSTAYALPSSASLRYRVSRRQRASQRKSAVTHRITYTLDSTLALGESCTIDTQVCVTKFFPASKAPNNDQRRCRAQTIGSTTLGAGDNSLSIRTRSRNAREARNGNGKQANVTGEISCTDGTNTENFLSATKARKISINASALGIQAGGTPGRIVDQMTANYNG